MTWTKYGVEFFDQCAEAGLSDAAVRTHAEALHYLSRLEDMDMRIQKHLVRRFAGSPDWDQASKDLVTAGFWIDEGDAYVVVHHENVFRQSLAAQLSKRDTERERQRRKRAGRARDVGANVGANVGTDAGTNVRPTQTDRHTYNQSATTRADDQRPSCRRWLDELGRRCGRTDDLTTYPIGPLCPDHQPARQAER